MALVVQKYGGSSVGSVDQVKRVAERIVATRLAGADVVVVCSAMGDTTDELLDLARQVTPLPSARELDMLLACGEHVSNALVAMAIQGLGAPACSLAGWQAGLITTSAHGTARITDVRPDRVRRALDQGEIVLVAGFQGISQDTAEVTTLGRGGSDATAVALAAALDADVCEIYTDVDGVHTADPRVVPNARRLEHIAYEPMLELAANGAKVLMLRCVEYARRHGVSVHVRSSYNTEQGTVVSGLAEEISMEQPIITGIAHNQSQVKVMVTGVPDTPGAAARIFRVVADTGAEIDMVTRNPSRSTSGRVDIAFTLPRDGGAAAVAALRRGRDDIGFAQVSCDEHVSKVSVVGAGLRSHPDVAATLCEALGRAGTTIDTMLTSEIRLSVLCRDGQLPDAVRALHEAFELSGTERARVYTGTVR